MRKPYSHVAFLVAVVLIGTLPLGAQQYGQWSWGSEIGFRGARYETTGEGANRERDEQAGQLGVFVSGYIIDPIIARFDVGLNVRLTQIDETSGDRQQLLTGLAGSLGLLPRSPMPSELWITRSEYDFESFIDDDALDVFSQKEVVTNLGLRTRLRSGPLAGAIFGLDSNSTSDRQDTDRGRSYRRAFATWAGQDRFRTVAHAEVVDRDYESLGLRYFDTLLSFAQSGAVFEDWDWRLKANAAQKDTDYGDVSSATGSARLFNSFTKSFERSTVELKYDGGFAQSGEGDDSQSHVVGARSNYTLGADWRISPFVEYGVQLGESYTSHAPRLGIAGSWSRKTGNFGLTLLGSADYFNFRTDNDTMSSSRSGVGLSFGSNLTYETRGGLRTSFEVFTSTDQLRRSGQELPGIPGGGEVTSGSGTVDFKQLRLTLNKQWKRVSLGAWGSWDETSSDGEILDDPFTSSARSLTAQIQNGFIGGTIGIGVTELDASSNQSVTYQSASLAVQLWRDLRVGLRYRHDESELELAPDIESDRWEVEASIGLGLLRLSARMFESTQLVQNAGERKDVGINIEIGRSFSGWLPIVTAPEIRGVVR